MAAKERGFVVVGTVGPGIVTQVLIIAVDAAEALRNSGLQNPVVAQVYEQVNIVGAWRF